MSMFRSGAAGMNQRMMLANLQSDLPPRDYSRWWGDDTTKPWADGVLWPNSRMQGGGYFSVAARYEPPPREHGSQSMKKFVGLTRDASGVVLGNAVVKAFLTTSNLYLRQVTSDAGGYFELPSEYVGVNHYLVAYKTGSPDIAGATVNTLQPS